MIDFSSQIPYKVGMHVSLFLCRRRLPVLLLGLLLLATAPGACLYGQRSPSLLPLPLDSLVAFPSLPPLDTVVDGYRFFFVGEEHRHRINSRLQLAFLLYLHQRAGVRNLIVEGGYSTGFLLNQYLTTGDSGILQKVLTNIPVCPEDQMALFRQLYHYNQAQPDSLRIRVMGIDLDHSPELSLQVLHTLLPAEATVPQAIAPLIMRIPALHQSPYLDRGEVKRFFKRLARSLARYPEAHAQLWGSHAARVRHLVDNTLAGYRFGLIKAMLFQRVWRTREARMYANYLTLRPYLARGGSFAQFGMLHTDLGPSSEWNFPTLAHRLQHRSDSPVRGDVLTISRYVSHLEERYQTLGGIEAERLRLLVRRADATFPGQVVLAPLLGPDSPFPRLSRSFQYILLISPQADRSPCE